MGRIDAERSLNVESASGAVAGPQDSQPFPWKCDARGLWTAVPDDRRLQASPPALVLAATPAVLDVGSVVQFNVRARKWPAHASALISFVSAHRGFTDGVSLRRKVHYPDGPRRRVAATEGACYALRAYDIDRATLQRSRPSAITFCIGEKPEVRALLAIVTVILLAGCGAAATGNAPTPSPTAEQQWSQPPKLTIDQSAHYTATVRTNDGTFTIELLPRVAPITVNNFVFLARHHFYDNVIFTRVLKNYVLQTGDPTGTGAGGPGYTFNDEPVTMPYTYGTVAMANSGPNTNGSQFFIVVDHGKTALPPKYTIFGRVISGWATLTKISNAPVAPSPENPDEISDPVTDIVMQKVTITETR